MTPVQKSDAYGEFFCNNKSERLNKVMWDLVFSSSNDPLYVQVYNSQINTVESLSLTYILQDLMFNYMYPFPEKSINCCNQINIYGFYFVSASIYWLIQKYWNEVSTNEFYISTNNKNCENSLQINNTEYKNGFYIGQWNMEEAYTSPCTNTPYVKVD